MIVEWIEGTTPMTALKTSHRARIILAALVLILGAYWIGARFGARQPTNVEAVPRNGSTAVAQRGPLTDDESINVRIYRQASPAVANILTKATEYDFFMDPVPVEGAGSGFVIDPRGYILTNFHVVEGAQSIEVVLGDQSRYPAKFIGADQRNDVALVKIDPKGKHIAALTLGDSGSLQVGQKVLAIGNPFGFQSTLTTGVVSALGRTVQTSQTTFIDEAIQTDAAINRGNSGGPLINSHGEVIGINSAIYTPTGTTAGIGFAIPINTAKNIANGGDVIVALDDQKIASPFDMNVILNRKRPGDTVKVSIYRGGKKMDIPVKLGERTGN